MSRISKEEYYLGIAKAVCKRSSCLKRHYGAVIVKDNIIVATGYNGSPRGTENCCDVGKCRRPNAERGKEYSECDSVHAEQNAIIQANRSDLIGATLYLYCEAFNGHGFYFLMDEYTNDEVNVENALKERYIASGAIMCNTCFNMVKNAGIERVVTIEGSEYIRPHLKNKEMVTDGTN